MSDPTPPSKPDDKPKAGASPPAGGLPPGPPKLPPGRDKDKPTDFRVIRSAPPPETGGGGMMIGVVALVVVVALAAGGYFLTRSPTKPGGGGGGDPKTTDTSTPPAGENAPAAVWERFDFLMDQGRPEEALDFLIEKQKDYSDAPDIKAKIAELRASLGLEAPPSPDEAVSKAQKLIEAKQHQDAVTLIESVLDEVDEDAIADATRGKLFYLKAVAHMELASKADALVAYESAAQAGYNPAELEKLKAAIDKLP